MAHCALHAQRFAFYDGELSGPALRAFEAHLGGCMACQTQLAEWRGLAETAFTVPPVADADALVERVMQRVAAIPAPRSAWRWPAWTLDYRWLVPAAGLAAWALIMLSGAFAEPVSLERLLLSDGEETLETGDMLGLWMEDAS